MCWCGKNIKRRANRNIPVFKIGAYVNENEAKSFYRGFQYHIGKKYYQEIGANWNCDRPIIAIKDGLHSYSEKCNIEPVNIYFYRVSCNGSHVECYPIYDGPLAIIYCIIPKGAFYYENELGEIVSSELIIEKIEEINYGTIKGAD